MARLENGLLRGDPLPLLQSVEQFSTLPAQSAVGIPGAIAPLHGLLIQVHTSALDSR